MMKDTVARLLRAPASPTVAAAEDSRPLLPYHNAADGGGQTASDPPHSPSSPYPQSPVMAAAHSFRGEEDDEDEDEKTAEHLPSSSAGGATTSGRVGKDRRRRHNKDYVRASRSGGDGDNEGDDNEQTGRQNHRPRRSSQGKPDRPRSYWLSTRFYIELTLLTVFILVLFTSIQTYYHPRASSQGAGAIAGDDHLIDRVLNGWGKRGTGTAVLARYPTDFLRDVPTLPCHSHNDYWRRVPLFSAIGAGCTSVEADVWLSDDGRRELYVGHDRAALQPSRTLRSLYVDPIVELLRRTNPPDGGRGGGGSGGGSDGDGWHGIFDTDPAQSLVLLIEVKTDGAAAWPVVMEHLQPLRDRGWLSYYERDEASGKDSFHAGPVVVVGTGNAPFDAITANASYRDAFYDAVLETAGQGKYNWTNSYYASTSFADQIGSLSAQEQRDKVRTQVAAANEKGLKARYWETPAWPIHVRNGVWAMLEEAGVGVLNVDDLVGATKTNWVIPSSLEVAV